MTPICKSTPHTVSGGYKWDTQTNIGGFMVAKRRHHGPSYIGLGMTHPCDHTDQPCSCQPTNIQSSKDTESKIVFEHPPKFFASKKYALNIVRWCISDCPPNVGFVKSGRGEQVPRNTRRHYAKPIFSWPVFFQIGEKILPKRVLKAIMYCASLIRRLSILPI